MTDLMARARQVTLFSLRVVSGFLFIQAGGMKLFSWFGGMDGHGALPPHLSMLGIAGVLEFFGGMLILAGLFTRPVAFLLSGEMAVAYWTVHAHHGAWPVQNQGMAAVLFCFIYLFFAAHGGGEWSLDALLHRRVPNLIESTGRPTQYAPN